MSYIDFKVRISEPMMSNQVMKIKVAKLLRTVFKPIDVNVEIVGHSKDTVCNNCIEHELH